MPMPRSVTRVNKNGVKFISSVDRVKYTMAELERAALKDTAKFLRRRMVDKLKQLPVCGAANVSTAQLNTGSGDGRLTCR